MHPFLELIETFNADNHARGVQFEKLCKWLLENHPLYKSKLKQVWLWDDWPERWGRDCGIDLVAKDVDGKTWAIQAKCYASSRSVTKKDIDSFLTESTNSKIDHRLLLATTDGLSSNAIKVMQRSNEIIPVARLMLSDLLEAPIEWPKSLKDLSAATVKKAFTPKPYQQVAIDKVIENLGTRGQLIMACGTGKTLTGLWIAEELKAETTLVLLPSLLLLSKTLTEWLTHSKEPFAYLPVCSDDTVAKSEDAINLSTSDLSFPSTTDADEIAAFINNPGRKVIFSTYQSSDRIAEAFKTSDLSPIDLIISDEAHRCAGKADSAYSTVLDNEQIPAVKRLFMTATPRIFQSSFKKKAFDSGVEVVSMDDETVFGAVLHKLSFGEAIEQDLLTDYQVVVVGIDNPSYSAMITERTLVKTDTDIQSDAQSFASHIGLAKAIKNYDLKRVISFHSRVSSARDFANKLPEVIEWMPDGSRPYGELLTNHVSGAMPTNERNRNLQALGNITDDQRYILSNARCLSEGVDVPALDGVAFIDPRNSEIDIVQAVGRAIRLSEGKAIGSIVIPVFIEDHQDPNEVLNSSPFKKVWAVVNALRSHDEGLGEELDQLRQAIGKRGTVGKSDKIVFDLPTTITHKFETALKTKVIESTTQSWEFWFGLLKDYIKENGDALVPDKHPYKGFNLGTWVGNQRARKHLLSIDKVERLNSINFVWDALDFVWERRFSEFAMLMKLNPDGEINTGNSTEELQNWIGVQRSNQGTLTPEKVKQLTDIGFIWDELKYKWEKNYNKLLDLMLQNQQQFKDLDLSKNEKLHSWIRTQRSGKKDNTIQNWKVEKLDAIGFEWRKDVDKKWDIKLEAYKLFKATYRNEQVVSNTVFRDEKIGEWAERQRSLKSDGKLSLNREKQLNNIDFTFTDPDPWMTRYKLLATFKKEFGHCLPTQKQTYKGEPLGSWVSSQRMKKAELTNDQISKLNEIGFSWNPSEDIWQHNFKRLQEYKAEFGHTRIKQTEKYKDCNLGAWLTKQRQDNRGKGGKKRTKIIDPKRKKLLDQVGIDWNPPAYKT
jgi:superfamily II DNA or RNA helicase